MLIALIGMSGSGKSLWSGRLAEKGFSRFCCDDLITERLSGELQRADGSRMELGEWMGFPFEEGYEQREELYLAREKEVLAEVLDWIESRSAPCSAAEINAVVDTTGSVIYTGESLLGRLKSLTTIVSFTSPAEVREAMLRQYLANPRPVLWRGLFSRKAAESNEKALLRSYDLLLESRERLYHELADIELDFHTRNDPGFTVSRLFGLVEKADREKRCGNG